MNEGTDDRTAHLAALGYVDPEDDARQTAEIARQCEAIRQQAVELLQKGLLAEGIALLECQVTQQPSWLPLRELLAKAYFHAGRLDECRREISTLDECGVETPELALLSGAMDLGQHRMASAVEQLKYAKAIGDGSSDANALLGEALLRTGQLTDAEAVFHESLASGKPHPAALVGLAAIRLRQERYAESAEYLLDAVATNKPFARAHYFLGLALMRLGKNSEAIRAFENFRQLQPHRVAPLRWLERLVRQHGADHARADQYNMQARRMLENRRQKRLEKARQAAGV
jgi:tetratricopeptide (TPR) repeat protein